MDKVMLACPDTFNHSCCRAWKSLVLYLLLERSWWTLSRWGTGCKYKDF